MAVELYKRYVLADCTLELATWQLLRAGQPVHLAPRPFQVLLYLIENRERMVSRAELLEQFWEGHDGYDGSLSKCIGAIRRALGDQAEQPRFIATRWAEGYRYIGPLEEQSVEVEPSYVELEQPIRLVVAAGTSKRVSASPSFTALAAAETALDWPLKRRWIVAAVGGLLVLLALVASLLQITD
jgi:DNA-binding winged helix-turn-helix (wHTH) protein